MELPLVYLFGTAALVLAHARRRTKFGPGQRFYGNLYVTMNALDALGNPIRREILTALRRTPLPVGALAQKFDVSRPAISRHLRVLQECGLVVPEERGTQNVYAIRIQGLRPVREYIDSFWDVALSRLEKLADE